MLKVTSTLDPIAPGHIDATSHGTPELLETLNSAFPDGPNGSYDWTFQYSATNMSGTMDVDTYESKADSEYFGAKIDMVLSGFSGDKDKIRFIQRVSVEDHSPTLFIDQAKDGTNPPDGFPFYYPIAIDQLHDQFDAGRRFTDWPMRPTLTAAHNTLHFKATTWVVAWAPQTNVTSKGGTVTIYDAVNWGWTSTWLVSENGGNGGSSMPVPEPNLPIALALSFAMLWTKKLGKRG